ncbi:hypothetical protein [Mesorhizobium sp. M8A.F.Ca.ET.198.01.1.1]|nr:hypothetical protein [Mesorhizobium sp. M8A.F.Ca.ET.198.01.1.1]
MGHGNDRGVLTLWLNARSNNIEEVHIIMSNRSAARRRVLVALCLFAAPL